MEKFDLMYDYGSTAVFPYNSEYPKSWTNYIPSFVQLLGKPLQIKFFIAEMVSMNFQENIPIERFMNKVFSVRTAVPIPQTVIYIYVMLEFAISGEIIS